MNEACSILSHSRDNDKLLIYLNYASLITHELKDILQNNLISVVVFGSAARGEAGEDSHIDILIVAEKFEKVDRSLVIDSMEENLKVSDEYMDIKDNNLGTKISPLLLTQSEIEKNPSLLKDVIPDGFLIYDVNDYMENKLKKLTKKRKKREKV